MAERIATWLKLLQEDVEGEITALSPMAEHTAFRIGGPADVLVVPAGARDLTRALEICHRHRIPVTVIGRGSNLLVSDDGIEGVVIKVARSLSRVTFDGRRLHAQAGAPLPAVSWQAAVQGLSGLEFGVMIPGSVGGAVVMNAGAHQHSIGPLVDRVFLVRLDGKPVEMPGDEMGFAYRTSRLQGRPDLIVVAADLNLAPDRTDAIMDRMRRYLEARRRTQPLGEPGAGSIFKNPPGDYAGRLIEKAGLKGWRRGDVEVSPIHANFIVNKGKASCSEVLEVLRVVRRRVFEMFGVELELEVRLLGRFTRPPMEELASVEAAPRQAAPPPP